MQTQTPDPKLETQRKRLRFRAHHMGTNENDLLFGAFADRHLDELDAAQLALFDALISQSDADLYNWVVGSQPVPAEHDHEVMRMIKAFKLVTETL